MIYIVQHRVSSVPIVATSSVESAKEFCRVRSRATEWREREHNGPLWENVDGTEAYRIVEVAEWVRPSS